jgi:Flp pilus assembly protein TadD
MALERCTQALTIARALEMAPLEARCHLSLGAVHHQSRRTAEARSEVTRAVEMFERMQMRYWLPTAEALLTETS